MTGLRPTGSPGGRLTGERVGFVLDFDCATDGVNYLQAVRAGPTGSDAASHGGGAGDA